MANLDQDSDQTLKRLFKAFNHLMLLMWRLGLGPIINAWPEWVGRIMVLTHIGRKSGLRRQTPLNYALIDGEVYCVSGFGLTADWYRNLISNPKVEVWLPDGWWTGEARLIDDPKLRLPIIRQVTIASGFAAHLFEGINGLTISDARLQEITRDYCVVHIHRTNALTGPGGPGDLALAWPLAFFILLGSWLAYRLFSRRSKKY
jgi:deazaflavin-dependent oxidoreductase (nitroreductase family)